MHTRLLTRDSSGRLERGPNSSVSRDRGPLLTMKYREPTIIDAFAKLWQTQELLVSFDGVNLTLPTKDREPVKAWPHVDQSPLRRGLQCVQGILNLTTNGPKDGGLIVLKGSSALNESFFKTHDTERETWGPADWFGFTPEEVDWFKDRGCTAVKVCAEPGDLILWDSRTVHYNCLPESDAVRSVLCKKSDFTGPFRPGLV